jgi:hypothetical protein
MRQIKLSQSYSFLSAIIYQTRSSQVFWKFGQIQGGKNFDHKHTLGIFADQNFFSNNKVGRINKSLSIESNTFF